MERPISKTCSNKKDTRWFQKRQNAMPTKSQKPDRWFVDTWNYRIPAPNCKLGAIITVNGLNVELSYIVNHECLKWTWVGN